MNLREWVRHGATYGLGALALNAVSFILLPIYVHKIVPAEFGVLELLNRSSDVLKIVLTCGMGIATLTFYQHEADDPVRQAKIFPTALAGLFILGGLAVVVLQTYAPAIAVALLKNAVYDWAVRIMLVVTLFELLFMVALLSFQARLMSAAFVVISICRVTFSLLINILFVVYFGWGLKGILTAMLIHTVLFSVVACAYVIKVMGRGLDWGLWMQMMRLGLPFVPGSFFLFLLNNGDRYFLQIYHGAAAVGLYALAYRLGNVLDLLILTPFVKVWGVIMIQSAKGEQGLRYVARIATYFTAVYVCAGLGLALIAPWVIKLVAAPAYWSSAAIVPLVVLAYLFWSLTAIGDTAFYVRKKTDMKPVLMGAAAGVCCLAYWLLIPRFGAMGAATATIIGFAVFIVLTFLVAYRYLPIAYEYRRMTIITAIGIAMYFSARPLCIGGSVLTLPFATAVSLAFPFVLYYARIFDPDERSDIRGWIRKLSRLGKRKPEIIAAAAGDAPQSR